MRTPRTYAESRPPRAPQAEKVIEFLEREMGKRIRPDSGIGIKPISETGTKRLVRMAIQHAIDNSRRTVTIVHKGNIMKFTEGHSATGATRSRRPSSGTRS